MLPCVYTGDPSGQLLSAAEVAALLSKEHLNAFGLLAPLHLQQQQQAPAAAAAAVADDGDEGGRTSRKLRGGALYPTCALLNHECIPNVARFDALDAAVGGAWPAQWPGRAQQQQQQAAAVAAVVSSDAAAAAAVAAAAGLSAGPHGSSCGCGSNGSSSGGCGGSSTTLVTMRALHGLPAGTEVVLSYVPLDWDLADRQEQMQQVCVRVQGLEWERDLRVVYKHAGGAG
jgi:SET and MYND domain-containing protein